MSKSSSEKASAKNAQEYSIRVPKNIQKRYHVMRFNGSLEIDFGKWTSVKMERENNMKEFKGIEEDTPKYGAGSEFGKEAKDEARRKKLGIITKKYKPDDQPWILKSVGSTVKKFKGIREGGVSENASYYVFTHAADGAIEAFPLHEWYKFQPIQRYKALSAEEAEQEFTKRNKNINFFSLMLRKRLKGEEGDDTLSDGEEVKGKKGGKKGKKELKISDMDEWMDSSDDESSENEDESKNEEDKKEKKKKDKKAAETKRKKAKRDTDLEALEDSDDGDEEGRELDYISDSSESEHEQEVTKLQGVAEEKGMMKMLNSDEGSDEDSEKEEKKQESENEDEKKKNEENKEETEPKQKEKKKKKPLTKKDILRAPNRAKDKDYSSSDFSPDSSSDDENSKSTPSKKLEKKKDKKGKEKDEKEKDSNSANSSRSASPIIDSKRKLNQPDSSQPSKKIKLEMLIPGMSESGITEESVRRYLMRKPMTTTDLLQKYKSKKTGLSKEQLFNIMTQILQKINPTKQRIKGKMYLSIK